MQRILSLVLHFVLLLYVAGCGSSGGDDGGNNGGNNTPTFAIGGTLSGLGSGVSVTLQNNGGDDLTVNADGAFTFGGELQSGANYSVQVSVQPAGQECTVTNGSGAVSGSAVTNVAVTCVDLSGTSGTLDTTFNAAGATPGIVFNDPDDPAAAGDHGFDIAIDASGRILVVGDGFYDVGTTNTDMTVWRYLPDGTPDTTFGSGGIAHFHNAAGAGGGADDIGSAMAIDAMGRILVAGRGQNAGPNNFLDMALWRLNGDGTLDATFAGGVVTHSNAAGGDLNDQGNAIALDSTGRIFVTGQSNNGMNHDLVVWCYDQAGSLDPTFNGTGYVVQENPGGGANSSDSGRGIAVDGSDRIVVVGQSDTTNMNRGLVMLRYLPDGGLDTAFDSDGIVTHDTGSPGSFEDGQAVIVADDGKIVVGGWSTSGGQADLAIWRFEDDGSLDTGFAASGSTPGLYRRAVATSGANTQDTGFDIAIDANDNIVLVGYADDSTTSNDLVVLRVDQNGNLDTTFNPGGAIPGVLTHHNAAGGDFSDQGHGVVIDGNGKIVVTGNSTNANGNLDMAIWRINP